MADKVRAATSTKKPKKKISDEEDKKRFMESVDVNVKELYDYLPHFSEEQLQLIGRAFGANVEKYDDVDSLINIVKEILNEYKASYGTK